MTWLQFFDRATTLGSSILLALFAIGVSMMIYGWNNGS